MQDNGGGAVHHVVRDEALSRRARRHFEALGYGNLVRYHVGEALQASAGPFDVIFNDIDKERYPAALPAIEGEATARWLADRGQHALGWADLRRGQPVGGDRGRAGPHARPREPSIVDQLADAGPRWDDRDALAAGVVTGAAHGSLRPRGRVRRRRPPGRLSAGLGSRTADQPLIGRLLAAKTRASTSRKSRSRSRTRSYWGAP